MKDRTKELIRHLIAEDLKHWRAHDALNANGVELRDNALVFDTLSAIADAFGVPADNTVETGAVEIANRTGEWPDEAYCRDFLYDAWEQCRRAKTSIEDFIAVLSQESNP